jgi:hypothetical protein
VESGFIIVAALFLGAGLEMVRPWREVAPFRSTRWFSNVALWPLAVGLQYAIGPLIAILVAQLTHVGDAPLGIQLAIGIPALDRSVLRLTSALARERGVVGITCPAPFRP